MRGYQPAGVHIVDQIDHFADGMPLGAGRAPRSVRRRYHLEVLGIVRTIAELCLEAPWPRLVADAPPDIEAVMEGLVRNRLIAGEAGNAPAAAIPGVCRQVEMRPTPLGPEVQAPRPRCSRDELRLSRDHQANADARKCRYRAEFPALRQNRPHLDARRTHRFRERTI